MSRHGRRSKPRLKSRSLSVAVLSLAFAMLCPWGSATAGPPKPLVTDARGDSLVPDARFDILSATLIATRRTLTAEVTLAGPPPSDGTMRLALVARATSAACRGGTFRWDFRPPSQQVTTPVIALVRTPGQLTVENCESTIHEHDLDGAPLVRGNTISWTVRRSSIEPSGLLPRTVFDQIRVMTHPPGLLGLAQPPIGRAELREQEIAVDTASSPARYVVP